MRTPWLILAVTLVAGVVMYLISRYQSPPGQYDSLNLENKDTAVINKVRVYAATQPTEIYYLDSTWLQPDSTPLKMVLKNSRLNFMPKQYQSLALIITYSDSCFYDLEIDKQDPEQSYDFHFTLQPARDTLFIKGEVQTDEGIVQFSGPMMKMYKGFILTYNNRMPPQPDSLNEGASSIAEAGANKTITVIEN
jgi:hypothetical protein